MQFTLTTLLIILAIAPGVSGTYSVMAADIPRVPEKEGGGGLKTVPPPSSPDTTQRPSMDSGIVVPPPADPHPKSVVKPPVIDPGMPIHPDSAPTTTQPSIPTPPNPPSQR